MATLHWRFADLPYSPPSLMEGDVNDLNSMLAYADRLIATESEEEIEEGDQVSHMLTRACRARLVRITTDLIETFSQLEICHRQRHQLTGSLRSRLVSGAEWPLRWAFVNVSP